MGNLSNVLGELNRYSEAEPLLRAVLARRRQLLGENHPQVPRAMLKLGWLLTLEGSYKEAESLDLSAIDGLRRTLGPDHPDVLATTNNLGFLYLETGREAEAEARFRSILKAGRTTNESERSLYLTNLGVLLLERGDLPVATPFLQQSLALSRNAGASPRRVALVLVGYGRLLTARGAFEEAEPMLVESLTLRRKQFGESPVTAESLWSLAALHLKQKRCPEAVDESRRALAMTRQFLAPGHTRTATAAIGLARALEVCGGDGAIEESHNLAREALRSRKLVMPPGAWQVAEATALAGPKP